MSESKLKSIYEAKRAEYKSNQNPLDLLNPLARIDESTKLEWLINQLQCDLWAIEHKNFGNKIKIDTKDLETKINLLVEISEYHFKLYEIAFQLNNYAFRAEERLQNSIYEYRKLKKENEELKNGL